MAQVFIRDIALLFSLIAVAMAGTFYPFQIRAFFTRHWIPASVLGTTVLVLASWALWPKFGVFRIVEQFEKKVSAAGTTPQSPQKKDDDRERPTEDASPLAKAGQAGDLFGGFTALVTALTFAGAMGALAFQARAMRSARDQLALQQFEPMFLYLLAQFRLMESGLRLKRAQPSIAGGDKWVEVTLSDATLGWNNQLMDSLQPLVQPAPNRDPAIAGVARDYYLDRIYRRNEDQLAPFFRSLYHVFKAIKVSSLAETQKIRYANIARLTLTKQHLLLLALNGLTNEGKEFKKLIEEYGLLKHLHGEAVRVEGRRNSAQHVSLNCYAETAVLNANARKAYWESHPEERAALQLEE